MGGTLKNPLKPVESAPGGVADAVTLAVVAALRQLPVVEPGVLRLCVGLSGGMDSVVLLHALWCLSRADPGAYALSALHVHHGLSPSADAWAAFCEDLCCTWQVPLAVRRVCVPQRSGEGLEGAARRVRHAEFSACAADWVALAQHRGDQAETLLLNLLRGSGVAGAAAMLPARLGERGRPGLWRPLLNLPREMLLVYARQHGLVWVEDESNADTVLRRNFLRHRILPRLAEVFPGSEVALSRATARFAEAESLLEDLARIDEAATCRPSGRIGVAAFNLLPAARARNLFRYLWRRAGFRAPEQRWVDEALAQLADVRPDAETCVATAEGALRVYRGELHLVPARRELPVTCEWAGEAVLRWGEGRVRFVNVEQGGVALSLLSSAVVRLTCRQGGETIRLSQGRPRRPLRKLLQESAIPPWERGHLPCLWIGDELLWVGGIGVDAKFAQGAGIQPVWEAGLSVAE